MRKRDKLTAVSGGLYGDKQKVTFGKPFKSYDL